MIVQIVDRKTRQTVWSETLNLRSIHPVPARHDYEAQGWEDAVSENAVDPQRRSDYEIVVEELPS